MDMIDLLDAPEYAFISDTNKEYIRDFDLEMNRLGYDCSGRIGDGYCWGKYMLIYTKTGVKSPQVYARIYIRESGIALRLFLNNVDKHRTFLEHAPGHIKEVFTGSYGDCKHDRVDPDGNCKFRKTYTLDGSLIEKCNGFTFEFVDPNLEQLSDHIALFTEFYPSRSKLKVVGSTEG